MRTGTAKTLIGSGASLGGRHTDGTVKSEERQAPMMRRDGIRRAWASLPGEEDAPGTYPPDGPVIRTDRLRATGTGQEGKGRSQAPPDWGYGSGRQPERTSRASSTRHAIRSHSSAEMSAHRFTIPTSHGPTTLNRRLVFTLWPVFDVLSNDSGDS